MKRLVQNIILFGIVLLGINLLAYRFIAEPLLYKGYFIAKSKMKPYRSFFLGDSHAKAIRQKDLGKLDIFNLAYDSDSYFDCALKLEYLVRNKMIDTAYICVDNHTLSKYREWWTNGSRSIHYANYNNYRKYYNTSQAKFWLAKNVYTYIPLLKTENSKLFKKFIENKIRGKKPWDNRNYDISREPKEYLEEICTKRIKEQFPDKKQSIKLKTTLEEMLNYCDKNNITVIGIKFPLTAEYLKAMGNKSYRADSLLEARDYIVLDFSLLFPDSTQFFRDQDHVNYTGSEKFTNNLQNWLSSEKN